MEFVQLCYFSHTIDNMSIDTIVRRRYLSAWIPAPMVMFGTAFQRFGFLQKCPLGFFVPMDVFRLFAPKLLRVIDGGLVNLVLDMFFGHGEGLAGRSYIWSSDCTTLCTVVDSTGSFYPDRTRLQIADRL
jgi:hypothetical protein